MSSLYCNQPWLWNIGTTYYDSLADSTNLWSIYKLYMDDINSLFLYIYTLLTYILVTVGNAILYEAEPSWISNWCSAIIRQESASKYELSPLSFTESLGILKMSVEHWISGVIPTWSMSWSDGDKYFATVINKADPSCSSVTLCNNDNKFY